ncbi:MAG: hypothetical protein ABW163_03170 [Luteimonas sp.]
MDSRRRQARSGAYCRPPSAGHALMIDPIPLEDLALLDVLQQISQASETTPVEAEMTRRLIEGALVEDHEDGVRLTHAGIALCKSLQHRVAADKLASEIIDKRESAAGDLRPLPGEHPLVEPPTVP